jgi:hypothetical protein
VGPILVAGLAGLILVVVGIKNYYIDRKKSRSWASVKGTVQTSDVNQEEAGKDEYFNVIYCFRHQIAYRYRVNEKEYIGWKHFDYAFSDGGEKEANWHANMYYPKGTEILIYYNPNYPQKSTMDELKSEVSPLKVTLVVVITLIALGSGSWLLWH